MTGNIYKRGSSWSVRYDEPSPDGRRKQRSKGGFATRKDAQRFLTDALARLDSGLYADALAPQRRRVPDRRIASGRRRHAARPLATTATSESSGSTSPPASALCGSRPSRPGS